MTFEQAIELVLSHEGGFQNHPEDRGNWTGGQVGVGQLKGTRWGISAMAYPELDIANLTRTQAIEIYRRDYWKRAGCDKLPDFLRYPYFDVAVNSGPGTAARLLQQAAGVTPDGVLGPVTLAAVAARDPRELTEDFLWLRGEFFADLARRVPSQRAFLPGWILRLTAVRKVALGNARAPAAPTPPDTPPPAERPVLTRGSTGEHVRKLQEMLKSLGFDIGPTDGDFGARTESAVMRFQRQAGLLDDGIVGPITWRALEDALK